MLEIREFAAAKGVLPSTVLQKAAALSGTTWAKWESGKASCSMNTAARIRKYMDAQTGLRGDERGAA